MSINHRAFTLIELLVVVLIIGILSAIALPQYQRAVERARAAELITNVAALQRAVDVRILENNGLSSADSMSEIIETELTGGVMDGYYYKTKNFWYWGMTWTNGGEIFVFRGGDTAPDYKYSVYIVVSGKKWTLSGNFPNEYQYMQEFLSNSIRHE